jgi:hypothetical protein
MSYGSVYIESDINKLKNLKYSKRTIVRVIAQRIRYRYPDISRSGAIQIAVDTLNGKSESNGWKSKSRNKNVNISQRDVDIWKKAGLGSL